MLKRTVTETVVVVRDASLLKTCDAAGINAIVVPDAAEPVCLQEAYVVCVDEVAAFDMALSIVDLGVEPENVECVDLEAYPDGARALLEGGISRVKKHARDIYFNEIRRLIDAKEDEALKERIPCGLPYLDDYIRWRRRELCVVAGAYGCGKSLFMQMLGMKWAEATGGLYPDGSKREVPVWFCTWEDDPIEQNSRILRHYTNGSDCPEDWQVKAARNMQSRILHTKPELERDRHLEWYMDRARYMNRKYGTNFFVLDPWSEFDHVRGQYQTETEYVKAVMKALRMLSVELNSVFVVITHITKSKYSDDGTIRPFRVADAMGSVQFGSTADRCICVMRTSKLVGPNPDHMVVHFDKTKVERTMGRRGTVALSYSDDRHELRYDADATRMAAEAWGGVHRAGPQTEVNEPHYSGEAM